MSDRDPIDKYFVNPDETPAAREKLGLIKERFAGWAFGKIANAARSCAGSTTTRSTPRGPGASMARN
ncbi:MAG: hypothetical protein IPN75_18345 [Dechloromonas sp.]|uniref:Uncharacterized protein n=1 Tax=Candidatus Dechloromonas phosphorivorans TaxID=2899244 RepID=A0A9D7LTJ7_9RHOO|nr:hypothetical protein [Candidatus Dechloromonas phosphorivorans]